MHSETNHAKADLKFAAAWGPKCCNPVLIGCHERELISFVKKKKFLRQWKNLYLLHNWGGKLLKGRCRI